MQTISIKAGTRAIINITPKINGVEATPSELAGIKVYVFFIHQFTHKIYGEPYVLTSDNLTINLSSADTVAMLKGAEENQKFEIQFAIKDASGNVISEEKDSEIAINITRWEAGEWLQRN